MSIDRPTTTEIIETDIARGMSNHWIMHARGVTYRQVYDAKQRMEAAVAPPKKPGRKVKKHGTIGGYARHLRDKTVPCDLCREANNARSRKHRAKRSAA